MNKQIKQIGIPVSMLILLAMLVFGMYRFYPRPEPVVVVPRPFVQSFDGAPSGPQPWHPADWDVTVHSRDRPTWDQLPAMQAMHGWDCGAPPATHDVSSYDDAVFLCKDHVMTAINGSGGYSVIYLTPNQLVDFSTGEAVIRFDLSTLRTSTRDWIDLWISPYEDHLQLPLQDYLPDLNGEPRNAVHIRMDTFKDQTVFKASVVRDFQAKEIKDTNWWTGYESVLQRDAKRRETFELRISKDHVKFGLPAHNLWWIDKPIPELGWSRGVVQFGHHSYTPKKDCTNCGPNTWHWDNISIDKAVPFAIIRADRRVVDAKTDTAVEFPKTAPAGAHLQFTGIGKNLEVSFNDGNTWQPAKIQAQKISHEDHFQSYWMPVPEGTSSVMFRGQQWWGGGWNVRDISIWAK